MLVKFTSLKVTEDLLNRLRRLARLRSEKSDRDILWSEVSRELLERAVNEEEKRLNIGS